MSEGHPVVAAVMDDPVVKAAIDEVAGPAGEARAVASEAAAKLETAGSREAAAALATRLSDEDTLRTAGQRAINRVWEDTQMRLALLTVGGFMMAHIFVVIILALVLLLSWSRLAQLPAALAALVAILTGSLGAIASLASLVIGFYFSRTNHTRTGGVGVNDVGR